MNSVCPKCKSHNYARERRPDGDTKCIDCGYSTDSKLWDAYNHYENRKTGIEVCEPDVEYDWNLYHDMDTRSYHDVNKIKELENKLKEAVQTIDNLVAANEAVHQDEIGSQLDYYDEKHKNEELELKILDLEKEIETLKTALLDIVNNKPVNTYRTNLGDALERHKDLIKELQDRK